MKNGIDLLLILILLVAIGLLIFFGIGEPATGTAASVTLTPDSISATPEVVPSILTPTPTRELTSTLLPASVTIPTKTITVTPLPTKTPSGIPSETPSLTNTLPTDLPISRIDQEIKSGIERGNTIVKAIETYHGSNGRYPSALDDLVPADLLVIPMTSTGQAFFYRLFEPGSPLAPEVYWVSFRAIDQDHVTCTYFRRLDFWDCDFTSP